MQSKIEIVNSLIVFAKDTYELIFAITIGSAAQVFLVARAKDKEGKKLSKWMAFGIFFTAATLGWVGGQLAVKFGHDDIQSVVASLSCLFSLSVISSIQDNIPAITKKVTEFFGGKNI